MANANFDNYYPHTLKVDEIVGDTNTKNSNRKNLQNIQQYEDYLCVLENTGIEYPELALGLAYRSARTKGERKRICEDIDADEGRIYIRKDDWINPDEAEYECGVFNLDGSRKKYDNSTKDPRKFPSTKLCDKYYEKDNGEDYYTKMIPSKLERPVKDLRGENVEQEIRSNTRSRIFWITYFVLTVFIIYWTASYEVEKPYAFYDYVYSVFFNKAIILILLFGFFIYTFCPFNTCYTNPDDPLYIRDFNRAAKELVCSYTDNNVSYLEEGISLKYDNSKWMKKLDSIISVLFNVNRKIERPLKYLNKQICNYCDVKYDCIHRKPLNTMQIIKPYVITVFSSDLKNNTNEDIVDNATNKNYLSAINSLYKYRKINNYDKSGKIIDHHYVPYDTGTIIHLKTDDEFNNLLLMCVLIMKSELSTEETLSGINGVDYSYQWIVIRDRNGVTFYNDNIENLRIKYCPNSFRIFSVDTNYELLGYNISLSLDYFINNFENNTKNYTEFPFFPNFTLSQLKDDGNFNQKPEFIKRKLIKIYKYLTSNPSQKFRTKNITILGGKLVRYESYISSQELNSSKIKLYFNKCNRYINKIDELNSFFNDDENDEDYLKFYYTNKNDEYQSIEKDYYDVTFYNMDINKIINYLKINDEDLDVRDFMYKFYQCVIHLNYVQRDSIRLKIVEKLMEKFNFEEYDYLDSYESLKHIDLTSINIEDEDDKYNIILERKNIVEEIVKDHYFIKKSYEQDGIVNECIFCKQRCKT